VTGKPSVQPLDAPDIGARSLEQRARHAAALFEGIDDAVFVHDLEGRILDLNPAASRRLGYTRAELLRMTTRDIDAPEFAAGFPERLRAQLAAGRLSCEGCHVAKDGRRIPVDINTSYIEFDGRPAVLAVMRDISARKTAERRLEAQYAVTRALAESATLGEAAPKILQAVGDGLGWELGSLWRVDEEEQVLRCAGTWHAAGIDAAAWEAAAQPLALAPGQAVPGQVWATGEPVWLGELGETADADHARRARQAGAGTAFALPVRGASQVVGVLEFFGRAIAPPDDALRPMLRALGSQVGQFIERRRAEKTQERMQQRLMLSEKLASIGLLSAGIAHEINNPLAYVANNLAVLERDLHGQRDLLQLYEGARPRMAEADPDAARRAAELAAAIDLPYIQENLDRILARTREGVERMAKIVQVLRALARTDRPQFEPAALPELVAASLEMVRGRMQRRGIRLDLRYEDGLPPLRCVATQISQVLLNLLVNAVQAVEAKDGADGGRVGVDVRRLGREVLIEVSDNGCGVDAKDLPRIFDPFYTSKPVGEGTGLGLSISHGIVTGHGGRIEVESRLGEGSRFRVFLPLDPQRGAA
jgi:PAS domain S-box-containing protein